MDSLPNQSNVAQVQTSAPSPIILTTQSKPGYMNRLFSGRLNRQNYIVGSTFFVLIPLLCFLVVIFNIVLSPAAFAMPYLDPNNPTNIITPQVSIVQLLNTPTNRLWGGIGIIFIILSLPYLLSIQIRRLHDLNLSGWLWIINFLPLIFIKSMFNFFHPDMWYWIGNFVSLVTSVFSIYITLWAGTKGPNNYGAPPLPRSSFLSDILAL